MNQELIRELAQQAEAAADEIFDRKGKMYGEIVMEKFAELIVRECAGLLWTEECSNSDLALEEFDRNSNKILQHFGVER